MLGNTQLKKRIAQILHDNKFSEGLYKDAVFEEKPVKLFKPQSLKEKVNSLKNLKGGSSSSVSYKKQVPIIGGNGEPSVEMEDVLSSPEMLKKRMLGAGKKSNVSFSKTLNTISELEHKADTHSGLDPPFSKSARVLDGSVPLGRSASEQLTTNKLKGGCDSLACNQLQEFKKGELPMPSAEMVKVHKKGGSTKKSAPVVNDQREVVVNDQRKVVGLSWNQLVKKVCAEQKVGLKGAIKFIKDNNLYSKK